MLEQSGKPRWCSKLFVIHYTTNLGFLLTPVYSGSGIPNMKDCLICFLVTLDTDNYTTSTIFRAEME